MAPLLEFLLREKTKIALVAAALIALFLFRLWQPERQVLLHQRHFLDAAQERDWPKIRAALDDGFRTSHGHDKEAALALAAEGLRPFFSLQIVDSDTEIGLAGRDATVRTRLHLNGRGTAFSEFVQDAVNASGEPFEFIWRRQSWKPWDWRLARVGHSLIGRAGGSVSEL